MAYFNAVLLFLVASIVLPIATPVSSPSHRGGSQKAVEKSRSRITQVRGSGWHFGEHLLESVADLVMSLQRAKPVMLPNELPSDLAASSATQSCPAVPNTIGDIELYDFVFRRSRPLVVRNGAQNLVHALKQVANGSFASLLHEKYGDLEVSVDVDKNNSDFNHFDPVRGVMIFPEVKEMKFDSFIEALKEGRGGLAVQQAESDFAGDLGFELPSSVRWAEPSSDMHHSWICGVNKTSHAHYDNDDGMLIQVSGSKRVFLVDPTHFVAMAPTLAPLEFRNSENGFGIGKPGLSALPSWHFSGASEFPQELAIECDVHRGDLLFIPAHWWHRVETASVAVEDGLNVAFNWWFFTDRLLRDQLWPFVQRNLFHVSHMWRWIPSSNLFSPSGASEKLWWPEPPQLNCVEATWGSFPAWQLNGRFLSRSRPAVLRNVELIDLSTVEAAIRTWKQSKVVLSIVNDSGFVTTINDLQAEGYAGPYATTDHSLSAERLNSEGNPSTGVPSMWPLGEETLSELKLEPPQVWLAHGDLTMPAEASEHHLFHWQIKGSATAHIEAPLPGLRRRLEKATSERKVEQLTCDVQPGDLLIIPAHWWRAISADERAVSVALRSRAPAHSLTSQWWHVLQDLLLRGKSPTQDKSASRPGTHGHVTEKNVSSLASAQLQGRGFAGTSESKFMAPLRAEI